MMERNEISDTVTRSNEYIVPQSHEYLDVELERTDSETNLNQCRPKKRSSSFTRKLLFPLCHQNLENHGHALIFWALFEIITVLMVFETISWISLTLLLGLNWQGLFNFTIFSNFYSSAEYSYQQIYLILISYSIYSFIALYITQKSVVKRRFLNQLKINMEINQNNERLSILLIDGINKNLPKDSVRKSKLEIFERRVSQIKMTFDRLLQNQLFIKKILFIQDSSEYSLLKSQTQIQVADLMRNNIMSDNIDQKLGKIEAKFRAGSLFRGSAIVILSSKVDIFSEESMVRRIQKSKVKINEVRDIKTLIFENIYKNRRSANLYSDLILLIYVVSLMILKLWLSNCNVCTASDVFGDNPACNILIQDDAGRYLSFQQAFYVGFITLLIDLFYQISYPVLFKYKIFKSKDERAESESNFIILLTFLNYIITSLLTYYYQSPLVVLFQSVCVLIVQIIKGLILKFLAFKSRKAADYFSNFRGIIQVLPSVFIWATFSTLSPLLISTLALCSIIANLSYRDKKLIWSQPHSKFICLSSMLWICPASITGIFAITLWQMNLTDLSLIYSNYTEASYLIAYGTVALIGVLMTITVLKTKKARINIRALTRSNVLPHKLDDQTIMNDLANSYPFSSLIDWNEGYVSQDITYFV